MPAVLGVPAETPCVQCHALPTVGYAYGGTQATSGRVCEQHGREAVRAGTPVAADSGGGRNWGSR